MIWMQKKRKLLFAIYSYCCCQIKPELEQLNYQQYLSESSGDMPVSCCFLGRGGTHNQ